MRNEQGKRDFPCNAPALQVMGPVSAYKRILFAKSRDQEMKSSAKTRMKATAADNADNDRNPMNTPNRTGETENRLTGGVREMLLSLSKRLPVDQRKALSAKLRAVEQDTSIGPARKAEIARDFIAEAAESLQAEVAQVNEQMYPEEDMPKNKLEAEVAQVKEQMYPEEDMPKNNKMVTMAVVEAKATTMDEPTKKSAARRKVPEILLSLQKLPADQRNIISAKLRDIHNDKSIDCEERAKVVSVLIRSWVDDDTKEEFAGEFEEVEGIRGEVQSQVTEVGQEPLIIEVNGMKEATARHGTVDVLGNEAGVSISSQSVGYEGCCCQEESMETQRDDLVVSVMSVGYEGCCCQKESMEAQRQRHGVVGYDYDYGEVSSVNVKRGRLAFMPGEIGMFVVTGRPPGLLLGG